MKKSISILALFILFSCTQAIVDPDEKETYSLDFTQEVDSSFKYDDSPAGTFFKVILEKYPKDYFPLGSSITFTEGITTEESGSYHSQSGFLVMDTLKKGNDKYLIDITPPIIRELSELRIFTGKYGCHWEISADGSCAWMGFVNGNNADFVFNSEDGGYDKDFIESLHHVQFKDDGEKERFCSAILGVTALHFYPNYTKCDRTETKFDWIDNHLSVTHEYADTCTNFKDFNANRELNFNHVVEFGFEEGRISSLKRIHETGYCWL